MEEFRAGEPNRLMASSLAVHGLYTAMYRIQAGSPIDAVKYPSRITKIEEFAQDFHFVHFEVLNADLEPSAHAKGTIMNGYWHDSEGWGLLVGDHKVEMGYFRESYDDGSSDKELQDLIKNSMSIVRHQITPVEALSY